MRRYKLLKDLPTFKAGSTFHIDAVGNLCADNTQGYKELIVYAASTLQKFPNILEEWFEEDQRPWRVDMGELYWFLGIMGHVCADTDSSNYVENARYKLGNYFKTEEEAEKALAKLKAYATVKRDAEGHEWTPGGPNYHIMYDLFCKTFDHLTIKVGAARTCGAVYFRTEAEASASLKKHRKEWVLLLAPEEE